MKSTYKYLRCLHTILFLCFKSKEKQKGYLLKEELIATVGIAEYRDFTFIDDDGRVRKGVTSLLTQVILVSASYIVVNYEDNMFKRDYRCFGCI